MNMSDDLKKFTQGLSGILNNSHFSPHQIRIRELEDTLEAERDARLRVSIAFKLCL